MNDSAGFVRDWLLASAEVKQRVAVDLAGDDTHPLRFVRGQVLRERELRPRHIAQLVAPVAQHVA